MTALVCAKRGLEEPESYYHSFKRIKQTDAASCSSYFFNPFASIKALIEKLKQSFPVMDNETLEKTLQDCNFDIELTITKLHELQLARSSEPVPTEEEQLYNDQINNLVSGEEDFKWIDLFVAEMTSATSINDAKVRAARALAARDQEQCKGTDELKQQNLKLLGENCVLKRALMTQLDIAKGFQETKKEIENLSGMLNQCKEELKASQLNNYWLSHQLNQAMGCSPMINTTNLPPDVY